MQASDGREFDTSSMRLMLSSDASREGKCAKVRWTTRRRVSGGKGGAYIYTWARMVRVLLGGYRKIQHGKPKLGSNAFWQSPSNVSGFSRGAWSLIGRLGYLDFAFHFLSFLFALLFFGSNLKFPCFSFSFSGISPNLPTYYLMHMSAI
ncbi:hypothetical protein P170DRAFT_129527 [Aspergillus steynii IBT 23096]|uniref:Uncharacterized protein n=1 Tax=Aspergillus steynii IBT 23096 TaxID=1392250 RepID=A0A2I2GKK6_9EURO|nr:uncharacterized protein P170DRAFT_129527 [Aspergillus steynii IBT 23096]PLB53405.1 hypothetical protein P170DRAFT_129527 [Aspergillus steynii IBT 23096]